MSSSPVPAVAVSLREYRLRIIQIATDALFGKSLQALQHGAAAGGDNTDASAILEALGITLPPGTRVTYNPPPAKRDEGEGTRR